MNYATTLPVRIASPSPARMLTSSKLRDNEHNGKLDIEAVHKKAAKRRKNKRHATPVAPAVQTIRGFQTPGTSGGEESDISGASTPTIGPYRRDLSSVTSSPAMRPATPPSGISILKLKLETLSLGARPSPPRTTSLRRIDTGSGTSETSDSERTETESYEIQLQHDFVSPDVLTKPLFTDPIDSLGRPSLARKMTAEDFDTLRCLGKGTFGTVNLVKQRETGRLFAQKQLKKASLVLRKKLIEQAKTERAILESVNRHPFVVKLFYAFQDREKLYLILEYAQGGELFHHLSMERMFSEETAAFYMAEMVLALEHLHRTVGVVYRDLKPENCLLDADGHLLLTDFGLSKVPVDDADKCKSFMGTIEYMAPEVILGQEYGMPVDWWSLGALGFDLLTGSPPFVGNNHAKTQQKITHSKLQLPYFLGPDVKDLLVRLLRKEPKKRLGFNMPKDLQTIKAHRFFQKIDWKKLAARELEPPIRPIITDPELAENFDSQFTALALSPVTAKQMFEDPMDTTPDTSADPFGGFSFVASSSLLDCDDWRL